jgi:glycosyltransferase involved in cell wall biosynthesis
MPVPRRILVVSYHYPPDPSVGAHRWPAMAHYLRGLGHDVTVLTTSAFGRLDEDGALTVRTSDLQSSRSLRLLLRRPSLIDESGAISRAPAPAVLSRGVVPDSQLLSWGPLAARSLWRLMRTRRFDCLITNSRPDSSHLLGFILGSRRPAWIADLEDGWRFEPIGEAWPTRLQDRLDAAMERRVAESIDVATAISKPIADDLTERYRVPAVCVPNGWDPVLEDGVRRAQLPALDEDAVKLVHTGGLTYAKRRDPRPFLQALARVVHASGNGSRLQLLLAGRVGPEDRQLLDSYELAGVVRILGHLSREQAIALQRAADVLLLLATGDHKSLVTGKLFEYLAARRPILAVAAGNEAARIVEETHAGLVVAPDDQEGMERALRSAASGELQRAYLPRDLERYVFPAPAELMSEVVEEAVARHSARGRGSVAPW